MRVRSYFSLLGRRFLPGLMLSVAASFSAFASPPQEITKTEISLLPAYCRDAQTFGYGDQWSSNKSPRADYWVGLMGKGFWAVHHYCWAQIRVMRARRATTPTHERRFLLQTAIADCQYVIENSTEDMILLPEIYTRIGEYSAALQNRSAAVAAFERAREIKPDYWPAYTKAAELLEKQGNKAEALKLVELARQKSPGVKTVEDHYRRLGGTQAAVAPGPSTLSNQESPRAEGESETKTRPQ